MLIQPIPGARINLRIVTKADAHDIYEGIHIRDIARWTYVPHPYSINDAYAFIKMTQASRRKGTIYHFGIEHKETGRIIGGISVKYIIPTHKRGEIGYWINKKFWGQGYATEAVGLMLKFCFGRLKLRRVVAGVLDGNPQSSRALEKSGFTYEGLFRKHLKHRGRWHDAHQYGILSEDWRKISKSGAPRS